MFPSNDDRKRELECLRLASELVRLASDTVNSDLKAHCLRMAKMWSREAEKKPPECVGAAHRSPERLVH
jgi:hypothetical protein